MARRYDWIKFYPDDWNGDLELATCSLPAQGLMARLLGVLHRSEPYGYLLCNGSTPAPRDIAKALGIAPNTYRACLAELLEKGALKRDEIGIYSARMVRDQQEREAAAEAGKRGGNPLLVKGGVKGTLKDRVKGRVKPELDIDIDKEGEESARAREEDPPPPIDPKYPGGWEPTEESRDAVNNLLHKIESLFGVWPFNSKQMGNGEAEVIKAELAAILRLLSVDEVSEIVKGKMGEREKETKGADRPINIKWYMGVIKDAFYARDRQLEDEERRRDEERKRRRRDPADEPVPIADLIEEELSEEDKAKLKERFAGVREKIAKSGGSA